MTRTDQWKLLGVVLVTVASLWILWPSYQLYATKPAQQAAFSAKKLADLRRKAIHLGLDLQGGMHMVLEVDRSRLSGAEAKDAPERAMEIIRNRVDQFGVAEPLIQRQGEDRIVVQLPGLTDRQRAIDLIGKTALLEFNLVRTPEEVKTVFDRLDSFLAAHGAAASAGLDTALRRTPLTAHFLSLESSAFIRDQDLPAVEKLLATPGVDSIIPTDSKLVWAKPGDSQGVSGRALYLLKREPEMTGGTIASAVAEPDQQSPGAMAVGMKMTPRGRADFGRITGNNVGRQLAIVLDGVVNSAPVIRER